MAQPGQAQTALFRQHKSHEISFGQAGPSQSSAADLQPEKIERLQSTMVTGALLCRQGVLHAANFDSSP